MQFIPLSRESVGVDACIDLRADDSTRPYRMSLNNCCQLLQDRRAGQVLLGGYRHGQPMAVLLLDQPQFVQGGQAGQGLAGVLRPLGGKHRLQIARGDLPAPDALVQHHGVGTVGQQRGGAGGFQRAAGAERLEPGGLLAGQIAQPRGADGPQMGRDHRPAAASTAVPTG